MEHGLKRANVGCGSTPTRGWLSFDNSLSVRLVQYPSVAGFLDKLGLLNDNQKGLIAAAQHHGIVWADAARNIPVPDDSLEVLYTSHMVEHLERDEATSFFKEALRVLAPNGVLRVAVPDLRSIVEDYVADGDADVFVERTLLTRPRPKGLIEMAKYVVVGDRHHLWMYDGPSLMRLLSVVGFRDPRVMPAGETTIADPGELDLHERAHQTVYVEARK